MMLLVFALIGFGIYYMVKEQKVTGFRSDAKTGPEETLKQRYATGEIDEETFTRMMKTIKG
ncbi:conserved protein of unknown function [Petrocella atlantisensis]|uniref:SHOCT domain-containing protein n=1 Tax=Petrocella atlantisensis TaxID=2173034 RepID=A0A3P7PF00_9FIRM|nr:SHOCT domain-containing protein [Petrocella atlantisensis]MCF8019190.1 SHOCT domain-containing protein [Vallitaleaceae bacterium]VDN48653.1 conserved protein of unknown function [Petrocella atlantisensis]